MPETGICRRCGRAIELKDSGQIKGLRWHETNPDAIMRDICSSIPGKPLHSPRMDTPPALDRTSVEEWLDA